MSLHLKDELKERQCAAPTAITMCARSRQMDGFPVGTGLMMWKIAAWPLLLAVLAAPALAVEIDGRVDAQEWREARHITDFRKVQPLNGEPASLPGKTITPAACISPMSADAVATASRQPLEPRF